MITPPPQDLGVKLSFWKWTSWFFLTRKEFKLKLICEMSKTRSGLQIITLANLIPCLKRPLGLYQIWLELMGGEGDLPFQTSCQN